MIQGGWEFVGAAYGIVWTVLTLYGASLYARHKHAQRAAEAAQKPEMRG
jgi:hypothetical protein